MSQGITYYRRMADQVLSTQNIAELFPDWQEGKEVWMFVSAHDDDIVIGAGLTFQVGMAVGADVHAVVTTDGCMGYCQTAQRKTVSQVRRREAEQSFTALGLPRDRLHFLGFPDCNLNPFRGRHFAAAGEPGELAGASGLQNSYPYMLRTVRPTRVFLPTITDLHPDHRIVNEEFEISLFHAQGTIWPELGPPIETIPAVYEYATYCDFPSPPQIRIVATAAMLEAKLNGVRAYASQEQIDIPVEAQRKVGPQEYIREVAFNFYAPQQYEKLFQ
jgi:LmbE family N-acetylglucosaminyl deacetylase